MAFAGLDIGTSACKIVVYDLDGKELFAAKRSYSESGSEGIRELDAKEVASCVFELLRELAKAGAAPIESIAVASLGEALIFLDNGDKVLCPSFLTGDCRGEIETQDLIQKFGSNRLFEITGLPPNALYSLPKLLWYKNNTDIVERASKIFFFEDYIVYLLTAKRMVSISSAARSMFFDIKKREWSRELLEEAGLRPDLFSVVVQSGTYIGDILPEVQKRLGFQNRIAVVSGGHDQFCAAIGSGLHEKNSAETSMGTCEFMQFMPSAESTEFMLENNFAHIPYYSADTYLTSLEVTTCGALKQWCRKLLFSGLLSEEALYHHLELRLRNLKTDVITLPQFGSSGNPDLSMNAKGTTTNLTIHTAPEEIYLSIIEGISFQLLLAYERWKNRGRKLDRIIAVGGGALSDSTLQIRANIFELPVYRTESKEPGALGAMILAAAGLGKYRTALEGMKKIVKYSKVFYPDVDSLEYYRHKFVQYQALYEKMRDFS